MFSLRNVFLALCAAPIVCAQISTTVAGRQQDLNYVANTLPSLDVNFYYQLDKNTYAASVAALQARIATATDAEFYVGLAQLVAMSNDMHTYLLPGSSLGPRYLPLSLVWLDDGLFVVAAPPEYAQTLGTQIVAVNGLPIDQVTQLFGTVFAHANDQYLHSLVSERLTSPFLLQGLDIVPPLSDTVPFTFQSLAGTQFTVTIGPSVNPLVSALQVPPPDYLQNPGTYYWYSYNAANRMLYAKYNICEDDPNGISVATYGDQILNTLDTNPVDTVVIDFRGNTGGNEYLLFPLGAGLFERLPSLQTDPNFRIYLAIDQGSFSSGMYTPMAFKSGFLASTEQIPNPNTNGIMYVIGQPTGGKPIGFGNVLEFALPYSQAVGQYSTVYVDQDEGVIPDLPSFNPDIYVPVRSTDYFAGYDPVMGAMLARFTGAPTAPTGAVITANAASFRTDEGLAPGSLAAAFGAFGAIPDQVLVGGMAGSLVAASSTQVNFVVPASLTPGTATVSVRAGGVELAQGQSPITTTSPGIFVLNATDPSQPGAVENQDYSVNSTQNPALRGSIVSIYATGSPPLDSSGNAASQVYFGDIPSNVLYSGPVAGIPGLWQINAQVPADIEPGVQSVFVVASNVASNAVTVEVQ